MSLPTGAAAPPQEHSLPAIPSANGGAAARSKYSLDASSRDPAASRRAKRYVEKLSASAPPAARNGSGSVTQRGGTTSMSGREGFRLSPAESSVAAQRTAAADRWRSALLRYEVELRELVVSNSASLGEQPPTTARTVRALRLYDNVCRACEQQSSHLAELLRLFRVEFCRAIFANVVSLNDDSDAAADDDDDADGVPVGGSGAAPSDSQAEARLRTRKLLTDPDLFERIAEEDVTTYFDQVGSLVRENTLLSAEVAVGNSRARMVELTKEVERLQEQVRLYEYEVGRLTRQSEQVLDQCHRLRDELTETKVKHEKRIASGEKELQSLNVENKDLQLQLFRLRKQVTGGKAKQLKDAYRHMKTEKMQMMTTLFSEGDERVAILVTLSQLESRVNEVLDKYDNDVMLTPPTEHAELRVQMGEAAVNLLEEMHLCEQNYRRLVPTRERDPTLESADETDGYVAILFDQKIYENLLAREAIKNRLRSGAATIEQMNAAAAATAAAAGATATTHSRGTTPEKDVSVNTSTMADPATAAAVAAAAANARARSKKGSASMFGTAGAGPSGSVVSGLLSHSAAAGRGSDASTQVAANDHSHMGAHEHHLNETFLKSSFARPPSARSGGEAADAQAHAQAAHHRRTPTPLPQQQQQQQQQQQSSGAAAGSHAVALAPQAGTGTHHDQSLEQLVFLKRAEWVARVFACSQPEKLIGSVRAYLDRYGVRGALTADTLMPRLLRQPLGDLGTRKFLSTIDVFSGNDPAQQRRLCTVNYVDPAIPIELPERTNFIKIKYRSSYAPPISSVADGGQDGTGAAILAAPAGNRARQSHVGQPSSQRGSRAAEGALAPPPRRSVRPGVHWSEGAAPPSAGDAAPAAAAGQLREWGGRTSFVAEATGGTSVGGRAGGSVMGGTAASPTACEDVFVAHENLRVFRELTSPALVRNGRSDQQKASAVSSTTAATVAFQRLNPLSPNRGPEWTIYRSLFGGYRTLSPRMIEVTTIDHIMMCACERHFARMEFRYENCLREAGVRATNSQMTRAMAERFFRESYELSDFQEALVDELEARYSFPELVAKTLYEMLCYLDAMAGKDELMGLYLNIIRGFQPPTHVHYICYMLFHLSYCWPTSDPQEEISRDDALTVLRYLYRNAEKVVHVDIHEVLSDYQMTTRSSALTFVSMRRFMAASMLHQEESLLLYFNGLFSSHCESASLDHLAFESYDSVVSRQWPERGEQKSIVRFLSTGLGLDRGPLLNVADFAAIASSEWCAGLWR